jgi:hypothetical protein
VQEIKQLTSNGKGLMQLVEEWLTSGREHLHVIGLPALNRLVVLVPFKIF